MFRNFYLAVGFLPFVLIAFGNLQCSEDNAAASGSSDSLGQTERGTDWEACYFYSGGPLGSYSPDLLGGLTNSTIASTNLDGADPSCGGCDRQAWEICGLIPEDTKGRGQGPCTLNPASAKNPNCQAGASDGVWGFPVADFAPGGSTAIIQTLPEHIGAYAPLWATGANTQNNGLCETGFVAGSGTCNNCNQTPDQGGPVFPDGLDTCDGTFELVSPDPPDLGKVACFAHGTFGGTVMPEAQNPTCTSSHYVDKYKSCAGSSSCPALDQVVKQFQHVYAHCGSDCSDLTVYGTGSVNANKSGDIPCLGGDYASAYVNPEGTFRSCILKEALYTKANVPWPTWPAHIPTSNMAPPAAQGSGDGVALSWGHGVLNGACGAVAYVGNPYTNNLMLNVQQGMRAWSGEWTDAINQAQPPSNTKFDVTKTTQAYISEFMPGGGDSVSCLQPEVLNESPDHFQALMNAACDVLCPGDSTCGCLDDGPSPGSALTDQDCDDQSCHGGCLQRYGQDQYTCLTTETQAACVGQSNPPFYWCAAQGADI